MCFHSSNEKSNKSNKNYKNYTSDKNTIDAKDKNHDILGFKLRRNISF